MFIITVKYNGTKILNIMGIKRLPEQIHYYIFVPKHMTCTSYKHVWYVFSRQSVVQRPRFLIRYTVCRPHERKTITRWYRDSHSMWSYSSKIYVYILSLCSRWDLFIYLHYLMSTKNTLDKYKKDCFLIFFSIDI